MHNKAYIEGYLYKTADGTGKVAESISDQAKKLANPPLNVKIDTSFLKKPTAGNLAKTTAITTGLAIPPTSVGGALMLDAYDKTNATNLKNSKLDAKREVLNQERADNIAKKDKQVKKVSLPENTKTNDKGIVGSALQHVKDNKLAYGVGAGIGTAGLIAAYVLYKKKKEEEEAAAQQLATV
jgi:hypothetical protein